MGNWYVKVIWSPNTKSKKIKIDVILEPTGPFNSYAEAYAYGLKESRNCYGGVVINVWQKREND